jgi:hypothetical protein
MFTILARPSKIGKAGHHRIVPIVPGLIDQ